MRPPEEPAVQISIHPSCWEEFSQMFCHLTLAHQNPLQCLNQHSQATSNQTQDQSQNGIKNTNLKLWYRNLSFRSVPFVPQPSE